MLQEKLNINKFKASVASNMLLERFPLNNLNTIRESLTFALNFHLSAVSSCCVCTGGWTVCVAGLLCVETVISWSVAVPRTFIFLLSGMV